ncbi:hypothetical protein GMORB2_6562 [Geosmithia morbida]|uniref:Uncharacterized protein n=1 Tax=Geosmithia morbida TaxID=1094350 RepID=A0A9P4YXV9_9HYPO|nr:uncharacterized protein GMORB2_6562 [Geosmithia morbida]KAF4123014.1 hypothetical protein GMORB2_6562 [Geosmithia morbida]
MTLSPLQGYLYSSNITLQLDQLDQLCYPLRLYYCRLTRMSTSFLIAGFIALAAALPVFPVIDESELNLVHASPTVSSTDME